MSDTLTFPKLHRVEGEPVPEVVELLEQALTRAKAGEVVAVAVVEVQVGERQPILTSVRTGGVGKAALHFGLHTAALDLLACEMEFGDE